MIRLTGTKVAAGNLNSEDSSDGQKPDRKRHVGMMAVVLVLAAICYWQYLPHLTHIQMPVIASRVAQYVAPAASVPVADKPELAAGSSPTAGNLSSTNTGSQIPAKAATPGFVDSLMSVFVPSAKANAIQPEPPAQIAQKTSTLPAARIPLQTAAPASHAPAPLTARQKMLRVAQSGFGDVMNQANANPDPYGFGADENLQDAKLGNPILVYTIPRENLADYKAGQPVKPLLKPTDEWVVPIMLGDRIRFMVQVRYDGHEYVLGNGSRALGIVYDQILQRWPASQGFHPQLVVNPNMPGYYFTIPELPDQNMTDTGAMFELNPNLSPASVILHSWR